MVDALALGASGVTHGGSSPLLGTKMFKKIFKNFPIETFFIGIPCIFLLTISLYFRWKFNIDSSRSVLDVIFGMMKDFLFKGLLIFYFYNLISLLLTFRKNKKSDDFTKMLRSAGFWVLVITTITLTIGVSVSALFYIKSLPEIATASKQILSLDLWFFKTYPSNALNIFFSSHPVLGKLAMLSYGNIAVTCFVSSMIILIFFNTKIFRRFLISFVLVTFIGFIFWYFIPATSPRGYIDINIAKVNQSLISQYKATPAPVVAEELPKTDKVWVDSNNKFFNISTFPSMHAAWSILIVLSLTLLWRYFAIILIPWFIFLCLGAVSIYQHYSVDIIFGTILGILIFVLTGRILRLEDKYYTDKYKLNFSLESMQNDVKNLINKFSN